MATKSRYPGVNSFREGDHDIFCGRKKDTEELLRKIIINNTVVLHGDSGQGKSSLVQAGLLHDLDKYNEDLIENNRLPYIPVVIKMDQVIRQREDEETDKLLLVKFVIEHIKKNEKAGSLIGRSPIPYLSNHTDSLWFISKQLEKEGHSLLLILDQFEELQTYSKDQTDALALALSEIFIFRMPETIYKEFNENITISGNNKSVNNQQAVQSDVLAFLEQELSVRLLFVIREDKLGVMSLLNTHFPGILKNDYLLKPLTADDARLAISSPCQLTKGEFSSPKFEITPEATEELLKRLYNKDTPGYYEPIELQIICSNIERKLGDKTSVTKDDLPKVENAIKEFYDDVWVKARNTASITHRRLNTIKKKMIRELVVNRKRNLALKETLIEKREGSEEKDIDAEKVLQTLRADGLVREIPGGKEIIYYQLCHDRFIEAAAEDIQQAAEARQLQKQRNIALIILGSLLLIIGVTVAVIANRNAQKKYDEKTWILLKMLQRRNNPTFAYVVGKDWSSTRSWATTVKNELAGLDSGNNIYLKGIYALNEPVYNVVVQNDSILSLEAADKLHEYNTTSSLFAKKSTDTISLEFLSKVYANSKDILIYLQEDSSQLLFKDQYGKLVGYFKNKVVDNVDEAADVTISPDMKYVYIEGSVYNIASGNLVGSIKTSYEVDQTDNTKKEKKYVEVSALTFFTGNKLTAGFSDGSIRTYEIIAEDKKKLLEIDSLYINNIEVDAENTITSADFNIDGNKITALNADRSGKYLYVNTQFNSILIYDFQKSAIISRKDTAGNAKEDKDKDKHTKNFATEIKGHSSQIVTVSISPDNRFLLTGSYDHYLILWDAADVYNLVKVADFRSPYEEKLVNTWLLDDNNIFTLSEDDQLYWWKVEKPADLYKSNQLYRFSAFIYGLNLMNEAKYNKVPDPVTTKEQYHRLVNYLITIPAENPFPGDKTYNTLLEKAQPEITAMYNRLSAMPDYKIEIPAENRLILENLFVKIINILPGLSDVQKDIMTTKFKLPEFIDDIDTTSDRYLPGFVMNAFFFRTSDKYLEKKGDYTAAYTYMRFTQDSILPLLLSKYKQKDKDLLLSLLDYRFIRYCIYTGKYDSAISIADASAKRSVFKTKNFNYYKVATYLAAGRYDEATALFTKTESEKGNGTKLYLRTILRKLLTKNIRTDDITRFMIETRLQKEIEQYQD